jgi:hypothetical protein
MNVWHDEGDDGVTGWQPIGEPLIRRPTTPRPVESGQQQQPRRTKTMKTTINYTDLPTGRKAAKAIEDTKAYLGDRFAEIIGMFTQAIEAGEITTRKHVHLAMSFAGIQGYPVDALIEKYWPSLTA